MLLSFFLLFFWCENTVNSFTTSHAAVHFLTEISSSTAAAGEKLSDLQLVATPDYPVAAGQKVHLHCIAFTMPDLIMWYWEHQKNMTWQEVGTGRDLTLTKPEQSGYYRCCALNQFYQKRVSSLHVVYIISITATVSDNLGIAAFVLSLLALIINFSIIFWLGSRRHGETLTTSNTAAKGFPGPEKSPKGGLPHTDGDGDVYMNYTSTNQAYADLDPSNITGDNVYSSLS